MQYHRSCRDGSGIAGDGGLDPTGEHYPVGRTFKPRLPKGLGDHASAFEERVENDDIVRDDRVSDGETQPLRL
ncbi:MAG TPA: hypothetical protein VJS40_02280 [Aestuariivirgaceae bacterium]|nr:hypothetical protein [Aestuariivirgaceae bacterium]